MNDIFVKLQQLQDILSEKYVLEGHLEEIPRNLRMKEEVLGTLKKSFVELNNEYEEKQVRLNQLHNEFSRAEEQRLELEQRMDLIKTQREYEALDKEIAEFTGQEMDIRRSIQQEENQISMMSEKLQSNGDAIKTEEQEISEERERITGLLQEKKEEISVLESQEKTIVPGMDEEILYKFDRILRNKAGKGIVPISQGICNGCFMILPRQFMNDVRSSDHVHFCPYCSRILFYDEAAAAGEKLGTGILDYDSDSEDGVEGLADLVDDDDFSDFD